MLRLQPSVAGDVSVFFLVLGFILLVLLFGEILVRRFSSNAFIIRKVLHLSLGVLGFCMPFLFYGNIYPLLLAAFFLVFNLISFRSVLLRVLHDRQRDDEDTMLPGYGPVLVPLVFVVQALFFWGDARWIMQTGMLVMGVGDSMAALVGSSLRGRHIEKLTKSRKTVEGSLAMLATSFVLLACSLFFFRSGFSGSLGAVSTIELLALAFLLSLLVTAVEAILSYGLDNAFIPVSIAYILYLLSTNPAVDVNGFLLGGLFAFLLSILSLKLKFLDNSGATATFLLGTTIFGIGGIEWTVPLLTFYILSSVLSKLGTKKKARFDLVFEKGSQRDAGQVYANGGIAWLIMIAYSLSGDPGFFFAYLGTLAAVQSDTWATEIGTMWPNPKARLITTMRQVPVGTSGGVSIPGTLGAFTGALLICASAIIMQIEWVYQFGILQSFLLIGFSGLLASLVDSFFGATIQAQYYDPVREKVTERTHSYNKNGTLVQNKLIKGYHRVNNDLVNTLCALSGSAMAYVFFRQL